MTGKEIEQELIKEYAHWEHLRDHGGQDPFWHDGVNMNLTRNHIIYYKQQLEELQYFPKVYNREVPPETDRFYMAGAEEIIKKAHEALKAYQADSNYQYLVENRYRITGMQAREIALWNVIGYERGLKEAIEKNDLLKMRRHRNPETYLEAFKKCRKKLEGILAEPIPEKPGQIDMFDYLRYLEQKGREK